MTYHPAAGTRHNRENKIMNRIILFSLLALFAAHSYAAGTPPGAPESVTASIYKRDATIGWIAPANPGTDPIKKYLVTSIPSGKTCASAARSRSCSIKNLRNGQRYAFAVTAISKAGRSPPSAQSNEVIASKYQQLPQCGTAHNVYRDYPPAASSDLCLKGLASPVKYAGSGRYQWQCLGLGTSISEKCVTGYDPDPSKPHDMSADEQAYFKDLILKTVPTYLRSPSSFRIVDPITWSYSGYFFGNEPIEYFRFSFDAQNGFGVYLRSEATCPVIWVHDAVKGWWTFKLDSNLRICWFS